MVSAMISNVVFSNGCFSLCVCTSSTRWQDNILVLGDAKEQEKHDSSSRSLQVVSCSALITAAELQQPCAESYCTGWPQLPFWMKTMAGCTDLEHGWLEGLEVPEEHNDAVCLNCPKWVPSGYPVELSPLWLHAVEYSCDAWTFLCPPPQWSAADWAPPETP